MPELIRLETADIQVVVDPGRGSDILSIVDNRTGTDVMFSSPWRARADDIRQGVAPVTATGSMESWLEQYRGGWQTLCPNAGAPRTATNGAPLGYHGEASTASWTVGELTPGSVALRSELFSLPISLDRRIAVEGRAVTVADRITNRSGSGVTFDFAQHPALGGAFLDGECEIQTGARTFVNDFEAGLAGVAAGSAHVWPNVVKEDGTTVDLRKVPGNDSSRSAFGWLADFDGYWASVSNPKLGLSVRLDWDGALLPYAWFWQELNGMPGWPWFGRARVLAIEPSSTQTSGPDRASVIALGPHETITTSITVSLVATAGP